MFIFMRGMLKYLKVSLANVKLESKGDRNAISRLKYEKGSSSDASSIKDKVGSQGPKSTHSYALASNFSLKLMPKYFSLEIYINNIQKLALTKNHDICIIIYFYYYIYYIIKFGVISMRAREREILIISLDKFLKIELLGQRSEHVEGS